VVSNAGNSRLSPSDWLLGDMATEDRDKCVPSVHLLYKPPAECLRAHNEFWADPRIQCACEQTEKSVPLTSKVKTYQM